ncbi:leucine--tRNA ligase [Pseudomonas batumici]|uniref:Leucine--tRNA ligase n=1 Tax=Pseudomonas batumici TaxID=226910 RepID=A0A0C2I9G1_9PSED|nr:leucine--tRNA ligase [Pseudomonas batumici]KIH83610.1 Leucyl-tRNA synthetase [Pseudomonas batumici]
MDNDQFRGKWQRRWVEGNVFAVDNFVDKPTYYVLDMFPYPSGNGLHVGHAVGYIGTDIVARKKRMDGFNVLHPMGWDAFGLPAEQYAIKTGVHPAEVTRINCQNFKRQLMLMGLSYDWGREVNTSDKKYYRWTQFLFLKLYERGLVYEKEESVWWCEALQTVLANEEVIDGRSERGDYPCIKKPLKQWMVKITEYAERLLADLDQLNWPESVKKMQREWIGRTEGVDLDLLVQEDAASSLTLFISEAETLYGINAVFLCPEHPYVKELCRVHDSDLSTRIADLQDPKVAVDGLSLQRHVRHPLTGAPLPIYIVNYLAFDGREQAIFSVPETDPKASSLCKHFGLPYISVLDEANMRACLKNSGVFSGLSRPEARGRIEAELIGNHGAVSRVRYRMRDWLFSRQRYWGEPFPLYRDCNGNVVAANHGELPIELPTVESFRPSADGTSPLQCAQDWVNCKDAADNPLYRVTDTMPGWAGSCWYFLRFMDPHNEAEPFSAASMEYWKQVDLYVGGAAHATMHLLYARFWHKVLFDVGLVNFDEPFKTLYNQGLVTADAFKDGTGRIVAVDEAEYRAGKYWLKNSDHELHVFNTKMSKSLLNVVVPDDIIREFGVDTFRIYMMFMGPLGQSKKWDVKGIKGCERFLNRVLSIFTDGLESGASCSEPAASDQHPLEMQWGKTLAKVDASFVTLNFNTAIAAFMEFMNQAEKHKAYFFERIGADFVKALFPFAPHVCSEIWERLGYRNIDYVQWPAARVRPVRATRIYINGKYMDDLVEGTGEELIDVDLARSKVFDALKGCAVTKVIYVPNQIVNFLGSYET